MLALGIQDSFIQCEIFHLNAPLWFSQRMCRFSFKSEERKVGTVMGHLGSLTGQARGFQCGVRASARLSLERKQGIL